MVSVAVKHVRSRHLRWQSGKEFAYQRRRRRQPGLDPCVGKIPCRRKWQPTPVFLPGKLLGQKSLVGYSPWDHKELDTTEHTWAHAHTHTHTNTHTQDLSSQTRDGACVPCTVRWILNGRRITEVLFFFFPSPLPTLFFFLFFFFSQMYVSRGEKTKREDASSPYPGQKLEITHIFV